VTADETVAAAPVRSVLALGSNLGDRLAHLQAALDLLAPEVTVVAVSPVYETAPVGGPEQADYLNAVVVVTGPEPHALLRLAHQVEAARGRERTERWGPRTLDVDLVASGPRISGDPACTLPHPRAWQRAFVLGPWRDVEPDAELPGHGRVADLLDALPPAERYGVRRRDDLALRAGRPRS
jgi:2-amino-4-hydroxy-6-hydroxymethyldihydropteridine diphosphokinase